MLWIITHDHINTGEGEKSKAGRMRAPRELIELLRTDTPEAKESRIKAFRDDMNFEFRLYDDDGELYYEGLCKDLDDQCEESAFGPLDWAMNDVGATTMKYRKVGHAIWQTL